MEGAAAQSTDAFSPANLPEMMESLPMERRCPPYLMRQYNGFWFAEFVLKGAAAAHASFEARPTDIFLASCPKSGTTWLKALAFSTLNRGTHSPFDFDHPLHRLNPHDCVPFLEVSSGIPEIMALPAPRLLGTHLNYSLLPRGITADGSGCRLVYICREPKDALVSFWLYNEKSAAALRKLGGAGLPQSGPLPSFEDAFELFCEGRSVAGPLWRHALEYWEESQRRPDKVLFLKYEELLQDPVGNVKKLAAFMGCAFSPEEEEAGVVRKIVHLCSFDELKSSDVNENGTNTLGIKNDVYFRKGAIGDWENYMTPEMAARLDKIVEEALQGSGLTFGCPM
jgi:hypothetical protein